jgi:hypothetical protein
MAKVMLVAPRIERKRSQRYGCGRGKVAMQFTVGLKLKGKVSHVVVEAEDALIAALKVKVSRPDAVIMYTRPKNRRGDARHPSHALTDDTG